MGLICYPPLVSPPVRLSALAIPEVDTPNRRPASAMDSPSVITSRRASSVLTALTTFRRLPLGILLSAGGCNPTLLNSVKNVP